MKLLSQSQLAALLIPIGFFVALLGFWLGNPAARTGLQILGLAAVVGGVFGCRKLVASCQEMVDEA
jgi:hypothetical protein